MNKLVDLLFEARKSSEDLLGEGIGLFLGENKIALVDWASTVRNAEQNPGKPSMKDVKILGQIIYETRDDVLQVRYANADHGYGPILYYVLAKVSPTGYIESDYIVSNGARRVWSEFFRRGVPKRVRPKFNDREYGLNKELAAVFFSSADGRKVYLPLCYQYAPKDSKIRFQTLIREYEVGAEEFLSVLNDKGVSDASQQTVSRLVSAAASRFANWMLPDDSELQYRPEEWTSIV